MKIYTPAVELLLLARKFSKNYKKLQAGDYVSEDENYTIRYLFNYGGESTDCPIRISSRTGIMEVNMERLTYPFVSPDFLFALILWCDVMIQLDKEIIDYLSQKELIADSLVFDFMRRDGRFNMYDVAEGYKEMLYHTNNFINKERVKNAINHTINEPNNPLIESNPVDNPQGHKRVYGVDLHKPIPEFTYLGMKNKPKKNTVKL